ncbi:hypothetical protein JZU71_04300, partial [bacterium]|nr:hypothetical protein [bacterium]
MPWSDKLIDVADDIESLRQSLVDTCHRCYQVKEALQEALKALALPTLKHHLREDKESRISWAECFDHADHEVEISGPRIEERAADEIQVFLSSDLLEWVELTRRDLADGLVIALAQQHGEDLTKGNILNMPIPVTEPERQAWGQVIQS